VLRHSLKLQGLPGRFSFPINASNGFDNTAIIPMRLLVPNATYALPGGHGVAYRRHDRVDPRDIRWSTTYSF